MNNIIERVNECFLFGIDILSYLSDKINLSESAMN